jgi:hypothetical protein
LIIFFYEPTPSGSLAPCLPALMAKGQADKTKVSILTLDLETRTLSDGRLAIGKLLVALYLMVKTIIPSIC